MRSDWSRTALCYFSWISSTFYVEKFDPNEYLPFCCRPWENPLSLWVRRLRKERFWCNRLHSMWCPVVILLLIYGRWTCRTYPCVTATIGRTFSTLDAQHVTISHRGGIVHHIRGGIFQSTVTSHEIIHDRRVIHAHDRWSGVAPRAAQLTQSISMNIFMR